MSLRRPCTSAVGIWSRQTVVTRSGHGRLRQTFSNLECPKFFRAAIPPIVPFRVRNSTTITLSVYFNDPFRLQALTGTRTQRAVPLQGAQ